MMNQLTHGERSSQIPQVFPGASLMNPFSPQVAPQEFLMVQQLAVYPTRRMSWLRFRPQLLKIPDEYLLQLVASAETPRGWLLMAFWMLVHPLTVTTPAILKDPPVLLQVWSFAVYGQADSVVMPLALTQFRPWQLNPPLHPSFPNFWEQSTSCCSDKSTVWDLKSAHDSRTPTALKAQHDPQLPWFFTLETLPWATQSTSPTTLFSVLSSLTMLFVLGLGLRQVATNSASVRAENWLSPILQVWVLSALCLLMIYRFLRYMALRQTSSASVQAMENCCFHS